jgi:hypothetical protein
MDERQPDKSRLLWPHDMHPSQRQESLILKRQLQTLNQGSKTCLKFLNETKSCSALLAAARQPIKDDDLISYVLEGLNSSYTTFINLFNFITCTSSMSFEEFQCKLLNHEILLNNHLT